MKITAIILSFILVFGTVVFLLAQPSTARAQEDWGDAPDSSIGPMYNYPTTFPDGARHTISAPQLGSNIDSEPDGQPSIDAMDDDNFGGPDDEDGIDFGGPASINIGQQTCITVTVSGTGGYLNAWVDLDANGNWSDPYDQIFNDEFLALGTTSLTFWAPAGAMAGQTFARFRLSSATGLTPDGPASDGEVEDYEVMLETPLDLCDWGDAQASYPTHISNNGARHTIGPDYYLGSNIDAEATGLSSSSADSDDITGICDDEDGVVFITTRLLSGQSGTVQVTASSTGLLDAWIDFNIDGDWEDTGEQIFTNRSLSAGVNTLSFDIPADASFGDTFSRFRFSSAGNLVPFGLAPDGEVEDYPLFLNLPFYVNSGVSGGNDDGSSWANAFDDLQEGLAAASEGASIWVASGTYSPSVPYGGSGTRNWAFQMKNGVKIYGGFNGTETMLSQRDWKNNVTVLSGDIDDTPGLTGGDCYHVFYHPGGLSLDSTAVLDGFIITGGNANYIGDHCSGGGMFNLNNSSPSLTNCTFSGNSAFDDGGGMCNDNSSPNLTNCIFSDNSAEYYGGGMCNLFSSSTLTNCTFSGNSASDDGGGMCNISSSPSLTNCTFSGNSASSSGGGMLNQNNSSPTLTNCILWGNSAPSGPEIYNESSPVITYCNIGQAGYAGSNGNINCDPLWVNPGSGDFRLQGMSLCIDSGTNGAPNIPAKDFEGDNRIIDGDHDSIARADMGVDEVETIAFMVALQGDNRPPSGWEVPINIGFYPTGKPNSWLLNPGSATYYFSGTTRYVTPPLYSATRAMYLVAQPLVASGTYDITADTTTSLLNVKRFVGIW